MPNGTVFQTVPGDDVAPSYSALVLRPMDYDTIRLKLTPGRW